MSVLLETSKGDLVVDLYTDDCPNACKNFLKLCKYVTWPLDVNLACRTHKTSAYVPSCDG